MNRDDIGIADHQKYTDRILKLRERLGKMPLSKFTADELKSLSRVMGIGHHILDDPAEEDLQKFEKKFSTARDKRIKSSARNKGTGC